MADVVQVSLRGSRKDFFLNSRALSLKLRDPVIVQVENGEAIGRVFLKDPTLVSLKRPGTVTREIIRKATEEDLDLEDHGRQREAERQLEPVSFLHEHQDEDRADEADGEVGQPRVEPHPDLGTVTGAVELTAHP